ncbi:MAG: M1 family aminopeptidase [Bacteroidota bacterium]
MFVSLLKFELSYQVKQWAFVGFGFIFLAFGYLLGSQGYAPALIDVNSPYQICYNIGLATIGCEFVIMFFVVSGMLRDRRYQMESILYSTAVSKFQFWWSRWIGVWAMSTVAFSTCLLGFALGTLSPSIDAARLAPFDLEVYLWTWFLIVLPNVFICTSILFAIASWTRNQVATYVSGIFIYFLYIFCSMYFNSPLIAGSVPADPANLIYAALADPFGLAAFFEQTQFWTPYQKNHQMISLSGYLLWNRLIWLGISSVLLSFSYFFFSFRQHHQPIKKREQEETALPPQNSKSLHPNLVFDWQFRWRSCLAMFKMDSGIVFRSLPFRLVLLGWILISAINIYERVHQGGTYLESLYPSTNLMISLTRDPILSLLLIVFFSGELSWKAREQRFHHILDAAPISNGMMLLAKVFTLMLIPLILIASSSILGIGFQIWNGYYHLEIWQYVNTVYFDGTGYLLYILLALFIQTLVSNTYLGMVLTASIIALLASQLSGYIGVEHPLLQLGRMPFVGYTNMNGYEGNTYAFHHFAIYWTALAVMLGLFTVKLWQRGSLEQLKGRLLRLWRNWNRWEWLGLIIAMLSFLTAASAIYYQTNIVNDYTTIKERLDERETYERTYKSYESLPSLTLMEVTTDMDIFPEKGTYTLAAEFVLENRTDSTMSQLFLTERMPLKNVRLEQASLAFWDSIFHTRLFDFHPPLLPGDQVRLNFGLVHEVSGFETSKQIVANGSYISQHDFQPMLGYRKSLEIKDEFERTKRGLPKRTEEALTDHHIQTHHYHNPVPILFETTISTSADQIAIATGELTDSRTDGKRRYFHYKAPDRIMESIHYFSANYETTTSQYQGISIEQYYHPGHDYNIDEVDIYSRLALAYCQKNFGPYPFNHLRIAEIPGHWGFGGQAMPGTISMVEDRFYLIDNRDPNGFDLVAKRTIHEVAHQWWGMLLRPKIVEGGSFLIEGLAKYSEAVIMEKIFGKRAVWQLSATANQRYFSGRAFASEVEPPLYHSDGENYLAYGKSLVVMLALKELLGEARVNQVLRDMVSRHRDEMEPSATSLEFLEELYHISPPAYHSLIDDWLKRVMTYELAVKDVQINLLDDGTYEISASIEAHRSEMQENGAMRQIPINEPVQIGIFSQHPSTIDSASSILYLHPHRISQEKMTITVLVDEFPAYIAIDPFGTRIEENRIDNVWKVE